MVMSLVWSSGSDETSRAWRRGCDVARVTRVTGPAAQG
jgi:hypothetical protein